MRYAGSIFLMVLFCLNYAGVGQASSLQAASMDAASLSTETSYGDVDQNGLINIFDLLAILRQISGKEPATEYSDLDYNGKTDVFDLLKLLGLFGDMRKPLEVVATIGGHLLTEPAVHSFSRFNDNNEVRDQYHIYCSREIGRAELILDGDTVTEVSGTTPVLLAADPDTIPIESPEDVIFLYTGPKAWKITVWDKFSNSVSDSGESVFVVIRPNTSVDGGYSNLGDEIEFPLTLYGIGQSFGIETYSQLSQTGIDTFVVNLNPAGADSVIYQDIEQLARQIMDQVTADEALWTSTNIFGEGEPAVFVSVAVDRQSGITVNRLILESVALNPAARIVTLDGNWRLLSQLGYPEWKQQIPGGIKNDNFSYDREFVSEYKD